MALFSDSQRRIGGAVMAAAPLHPSEDAGSVEPPESAESIRVVPSPAPQAWDTVERFLNAHFHNPDLQAARALYSGVAAHFLPGQPVWTMLVAPPGSVKTELLNALNGPQSIHFVDQLTQNTFISGQIQNGRIAGPPGLLHRIGTGILICADFSTVLSINRNIRASILSDLRRIYDGRLHKEFGTADNLPGRKWRGRITFLAGVTPEIDRQYSIFQSLGERFLMVRWPRPCGTDAALKVMNQDQSAAKSALNYAVQQLLGSLSKTRERMRMVA